MLGTPVIIPRYARLKRSDVTTPGYGRSAGKTPVLDVKQISTDIGNYLAGFADGEGSFNVSFRPRVDYPAGWKVSLCFNISQRDEVILALYKRYLKCGTMRQRSDGVWYYEVNNLEAIRQNVVPFFDKFGFLSAKKKRDYSKFRQVLDLLEQKQERTPEGLRRILVIRRDMNDGGKRRYADEQILADRSAQGESSETIRQDPLAKPPLDKI
jgi:hypothetical protein